MIRRKKLKKLTRFDSEEEECVLSLVAETFSTVAMPESVSSILGPNLMQSKAPNYCSVATHK